MDGSLYVAGAALVLTLIVQAVGVFRYIAGVKDVLQSQILLTDRSTADKIAAFEKAINEKIESVRRETELRVEKVAESESKLRHDLANNVQAALAETRRDVKTLDTTVNGVQRDMIRRTDLGELEQRIMYAFERSEKSRGDWFNKLEKRINFMADRRGEPRMEDDK